MKKILRFLLGSLSGVVLVACGAIQQDAGIVVQRTYTVDDPEPGAGKDKDVLERSVVEHFRSSEKLDETLLLTSEEFDLDLTMVSEMASEQIRIRQLNRIAYRDEHAQGSPAGIYEQLYIQGTTTNAKVDLLIVVDSSQSMQEEQTNLGAKIFPLLSYLQDTDWQIGVITMDEADSCLRDLLIKGEGNLEERFRQAIVAGVNGAPDERGFLMAKRGIESAGCPQQGWVRSDSMLGVLFVSDEDNCSRNGEDCILEADATSAFMIDYLSSIRALKKEVKVFGLIKHPSEAPGGCSGANNWGIQYAEVIDATDGLWGSICDSDYSTSLVAMSQELGLSLTSTFYLDFLPEPGSFSVYVDGINRTASVILIGKRFRFSEEYVPSIGASIRAVYSHADHPVLDTFSLSAAPYPPSVKVAVDGIIVPAVSWKFGDAQKSIIFDSAPPAEAKIVISYRQNIELPRQFDISAIPDRSVGRVVTINQVSVVDYQIDGNTIVFASPPKDAAAIEIAYSIPVGPRLRYAVSALWGSTTQVRDAVTNELIPVDIDGDYIVFPEIFFQEGRKFIASGTPYDIASMEINLPYIPIADSVRAIGSHFVCPASQIEIRGSRIDVSECGFTRDEELRVEYSYVLNKSYVFEIQSLHEVEDFSAIRWEILVDGKVWNSYKTEKNKVYLTGTIPPAVDIVVQAFF